MMTTNFKMVALIILGIALLYLFQLKNSDYNLDRTISACIVAQKKTSKSYDPDKAKKFCREGIEKKMKGIE